jgi:integrase
VAPENGHQARARAVGLSPRLSPHGARVTAITEWLLAGAEIDAVQDAAGHACTETTLRYHRARNRLERSPITRSRLDFLEGEAPAGGA